MEIKEHPQHLTSLDADELLKFFFDPLRISNGIAVWKPDMEAAVDNEMPGSYDGLYRTNVDTVIKVPSHPEKYVIVFTTFSYDDEETRSECRVCRAMYSFATVARQDKGLEIVNFKRSAVSAGSSGYGGALRLLDLGNRSYVIEISSGSSGWGEIHNSASLYDIGDYEEMFFYESFECNQIGGDTANTDYHAVRRRFTILPVNDNESPGDISLLCTRSAYDTLDQKPVVETYEELYRWEGRMGYQRYSK